MALTCRWRSRPQHQQQTHAPQQASSLFDHLIGTDKHRRRDGDAKRPGSLYVNHQFKLGRLLDGHISYRSASQELRDLKRTLPKNRIVTRTIADEPALLGSLRPLPDGRHTRYTQALKDQGP